MALCLALTTPLAYAAPTYDLAEPGWAQMGGSLILSGTGCVGEGSYVAIFNDTRAIQVDPVADGSWSVNLADWRLSLYGNFSGEVVCYAYADTAPAIAAFAEPTAAEASGPAVIVDYGPIEFSITGAPAGDMFWDNLSLDFVGFMPGETVTIVMSGGTITDPIFIATCVADANGAFVLRTSLPGDLPGDVYTLTATGETSGRTATSMWDWSNRHTTEPGTPGTTEPGDGSQMPDLGTDVV